MPLIEPTITPSSTAVTGGPCRSCGEDLRDVLVDLGMSPLCESFLAADQLNRMEPFYPLRVLTCRRCGLAQLQKYVDPSEIFTEYAYFSSYSTAWLAHARTYTEMMRERLGLGRGHLVVELQATTVTCCNISSRQASTSSASNRPSMSLRLQSTRASRR